MQFIALGVFLLAAAGTVPTFEQFKVEEKFTGKPAVPVLKTRMQRMFRTVIREAAQAGPNFAGRFTLAQWGCGAGCLSMAVVDSKSGQAYDGPFGVFGYDLSYSYEGGDEQIDFRADSRLIVARGCPNEKDCGTYYYEWTGEQFKLIRKTPGQPKTRENP